MTIEIFQCFIPHYWYNTKVGETFEVISANSTEWKLVDNPELHILKSDCREIIALGRLSA